MQSAIVAVLLQIASLSELAGAAVGKIRLNGLLRELL